jgi:branched-chain amino acid transport system ATP-binding protein
VRRGGATVLTDVSLSVDSTQVVAVLGGNGVGKSTTLRTVSALHAPWSGQIRLDGEVISGLRPEAIVRRGIAHVPEGRQVFPGLSVRENLEVGAKVRGRLRPQDLELAVGLFPVLQTCLRKPAGVLSGGQQQMLAIARGLMSRPKILLLDEPTLGLAPKIVADIAAIIRRLPAQGIGVLLVEQNATMALDVAEYGYLMAAGRIQVAAPVDELRASDAVRAVYLGHG